MTQHQTVFQNIKGVVLSTECLSFGDMWETSQPVAWDSVQLSQAKKNYPTHEKEMLMVAIADPFVALGQPTRAHVSL